MHAHVTEAGLPHELCQTDRERCMCSIPRVILEHSGWCLVLHLQCLRPSNDAATFHTVRRVHQRNASVYRGCCHVHCMCTHVPARTRTHTQTRVNSNSPTHLHALSWPQKYGMIWNIFMHEGWSMATQLSSDWNKAIKLIHWRCPLNSNYLIFSSILCV